MIEKSEREKIVETALHLVWDDDADELLKVKSLVKRIKDGENNLEKDKKLLDDYMAGKEVIL